MHRPRRLPDQEVVDERPVPQYGLRPHPRRRRPQIRTRDPRQEPPHRLGEGRLRQRPVDLAGPVPPVPQGHPPGSRPGQLVREVPRADHPPPVPLAGERRHRVRPDVHAAADPPGQMHPQEGERRIRHRIHQPPHQLRPRQVVVLAPERNDPHPRIVPGQPRDPVALQARAVHQHTPPHDHARRGPHRDPRRAPRDEVHGPAVDDLRPGGLGQLLRHLPVVHDPGGPDMDRRKALHLRLVLRDLRRPQLPDRDAVLPPPLHERMQPRQLLPLGGDDQLAGHLVRDPVLRAELHHLGGAAHREPRLQRSGPVVDAAVDHAAVAARLVQGRA